MASKWISFDDLIARWGIVDFELLDYLKQGLPIYGSFLQRMYEVRPGKAGYDYSLREEPYRIEFPFMNFEMPEDTQMALRKLSNLRTCLFKMEDVLNFEHEHGLVSQDQPANSISPTVRSSEDDKGNKENVSEYLSKMGKKGGDKPKKNKPILMAIREYLEKHPKLEGKSNYQIAESFKRNVGENEVIIVKFNGCEWDVYFDREYIWAIADTTNKKKHKNKSISYATFRNSYISEAKKSIKDTQVT
jgi:hypothetical protein